MTRRIAFALCIALAASSSALAQSTSATIRGTVVDDTGGLPGASIVAQETGTGFSFSATTGGDGSFVLAGLRPGSYDITVSMPQYKPAAKRMTVLVGQNIDLDFRLTARPRLRGERDRRGRAGGGREDVPDRDQHHVGADPHAAPERPQLPELRGPGAGVP